MKTKKFIFAIVALFCCLSLTSCGGDDDEPQPAMKTITKAYLCVTAKPTAEQLKVSNLTVNYNDGQGSDITEVVDETNWQRKVTVTKFPLNATFTYNSSKKADAVIDTNASYKMVKKLYIMIIVEYSDGSSATLHDDSIFGIESSVTVGGGNVEKWLNDHTTLSTKKISVEADGSFSVQ